jgi:hypothetical protein
MYRLIQDSDSSLANMLADKKTVATVFAPVDDVSWLLRGNTETQLEKLPLRAWRQARENSYQQT